MQEMWFQSPGWEDPREEEMQPTPAVLPGESHGQRSLAGFSPWGHKGSDTTEWLSTHACVHTRNVTFKNFESVCYTPTLCNWRRQWHPTPVLLPGKSHGQRSLVGCSPWGCKESDTNERLHFHFHFHIYYSGLYI